MASEDTLQYAEREQQQADTYQDEIAKQQAKITDLQNVNGADMTDDIARERDIMESYQHKQQRHSEAAQQLRDQAMEEQKAEQQEQQRQGEEGFVKREAKEAIKRSLF